MATMSDETRTFYNPVTFMTEDAAPAYARAAGLVEWDGEVEVDEAGIVRASLAGSDLGDLGKAGLKDRARELGLDTKGTIAELKARIAAHVDEQSGEAVFTGAPVAFDPTELHGEPAAGDAGTIDPQEEGQ